MMDILLNIFVLFLFLLLGIIIYKKKIVKVIIISVIIMVIMIGVVEVILSSGLWMPIAIGIWGWIPMLSLFLVILLIAGIIIFKKNMLTLIVISGIMMVGIYYWAEYRYGDKEEDHISYRAPCWGPNNKIFFIKVVTRVVYSRLGGGISPCKKRIIRSELYLCSMNYDGSKKKEIVKIGDTRERDYWAPFYLDYCESNDLILLSGEIYPGAGMDFSGIYTIKSDGSNRRKISDKGWHASWSPDGKRIVMGPAAIIDADTGKTLFEGINGARNPIWSPKGDLIAFVCKGWIWVMKPDGSERRRIRESMYLMDWSSEGDKIIIAGGIVGLNGELLKELEFGGYSSPDGRLLINPSFDILEIETGKRINPFADIKHTKHFVYKKPK